MPIHNLRMIEGQIDGLVVNWATAKGYDVREHQEAWRELREGAGDRAHEHRLDLDERFSKARSRFL